MKSLLALLLTVFLFGPFAVFAQDKAARLEDLQKNEAKWASHRISDYEVTLRNENCYCLYGPYYGPVRVFVKGGRISKVIYLGEARDGFKPGNRLRGKAAYLAKTIDGLFEDVRFMTERASDKTSLNISYDDTFGFPVLIDFDRSDLSDVQSRIVVTDFIKK